jgi:hypothetical protein
MPLSVNLQALLHAHIERSLTTILVHWEFREIAVPHGEDNMKVSHLTEATTIAMRSPLQIKGLAETGDLLHLRYAAGEVADRSDDVNSPSPDNLGKAVEQLRGHRNIQLARKLDTAIDVVPGIGASLQYDRAL